MSLLIQDRTIEESILLNFKMVFLIDPSLMIEKEGLEKTQIFFLKDHPRFNSSLMPFISHKIFKNDNKSPIALYVALEEINKDCKERVLVKQSDVDKLLKEYPSIKVNSKYKNLDDIINDKK